MSTAIHRVRYKKCAIGYETKKEDAMRTLSLRASADIVPVASRGTAAGITNSLGWLGGGMAAVILAVASAPHWNECMRECNSGDLSCNWNRDGNRIPMSEGQNVSQYRDHCRRVRVRGRSLSNFVRCCWLGGSCRTGPNAPVYWSGCVRRDVASRVEDPCSRWLV